MGKCVVYVCLILCVGENSHIRGYCCMGTLHTPPQCHNVAHMCERTHAHTHRLFVVIQSYDVHAVREIAAEHSQFETPCAGSLLLHCDHHSTLVCPELSSAAGYEPIAALV